MSEPLLLAGAVGLMVGGYFVAEKFSSPPAPTDLVSPSTTLIPTANTVDTQEPDVPGAVTTPVIPATPTAPTAPATPATPAMPAMSLAPAPATLATPATALINDYVAPTTKAETSQYCSEFFGKQRCGSTQDILAEFTSSYSTSEAGRKKVLEATDSTLSFWKSDDGYVANNPGLQAFADILGKNSELKSVKNSFKLYAPKSDGKDLKLDDYGRTWGLSNCIDTNYWTPTSNGARQVSRVCPSAQTCAASKASLDANFTCAVAVSKTACSQSIEGLPKNTPQPGKTSIWVQGNAQSRPTEGLAEKYYDCSKQSGLNLFYFSGKGLKKYQDALGDAAQTTPFSANRSNYGDVSPNPYIYWKGSIDAQGGGGSVFATKDQAMKAGYKG